jgi:hypothetical protein
MRSTQRETSWITEAVRRKEADLAGACASAATHMRDAGVAARLAEAVFEHLRHSRPHLECTNDCAREIDTSTLRSRARRPYALWDALGGPRLEAAVDGAVAGAIARAHAEIALFIDDACGSLLVAPAERERLFRVALCTAALGDALAP